MKLHCAGDVANDSANLVCRNSQLAAILRFIVFSGAVAFVIYWGWESGRRWLLIWGLVIAAILIPWLLIDMLATFRATNWVLQVASDGVWINLRSYRDKDFETPTVVQINFREIASAGRHIEKYTTPSERTGPTSYGAVGGDIQWRDVFLEFRLTHDQTDELLKALNDIRSPISQDSSTKLNVRHLHYPLWLADRFVIRIPWLTGHGHAVAPRLSRVLNELETHVPVAAQTVRKRPHWTQLNSTEVVELARELIQVHGDEFSATDLLVRAGGVTYGEAGKLVRQISQEEVGRPESPVSLSG